VVTGNSGGRFALAVVVLPGLPKLKPSFGFATFMMCDQNCKTRSYCSVKEYEYEITKGNTTGLGRHRASYKAQDRSYLDKFYVFIHLCGLFPFIHAKFTKEYISRKGVYL
jgi:hypothetical protein